MRRIGLAAAGVMAIVDFRLIDGFNMLALF
jgi:hypothetical protein